MEQDERDRRDGPDGPDGPPANDSIPIDPAAPHSEPPEPEPIEPEPIRSEAADAPQAEPVPREPSWPAEPAIPSEPDAPEAPAEPPSAEIESWPSSGEASPTQEEAETRPWPTEPPAAGSADVEAWPTSPPERGEEPILEPRSEAPEPPPSEVEAYPAEPIASQSDADAVDASAAAAAAATGMPAAAHSVPDSEAAVGEGTQCPRCGTENRPGLAFCRNCGQRLMAAGVATTVERPGAPEGTTACPRCGTHNRAGVAFCQNCGANLRGTAPGYVPPAVAAEPGATAAEAARGGAILGPVVLLIGLVGLITAYLLPFVYRSGSLFDRAVGSDGYGVAFWDGYSDVGANLADQAYFGLAGPVPILGLILLGLAIAGFLRAGPGALQRIGLVIALLWSIGLIVLFVVVELAGHWSGDIVGMLRELSPAGIIFFLSGLIVLIGTLTRFGRA